MDEQNNKVEVTNSSNNNIAAKNNELVQPVINNNFSMVFNASELAELEIFFKRYITSAKSGITTVADGIAIAMRARDLRIPLSTCVEHIHVVNGKTGIDVHIVKTLLIKGSVSWDCIDNYRALYEYTDGINVYLENKLPIDCIKCKSSIEAESKSKDDDSNVYVYPVKYYQDFAGTIYKEYQFNDKFAIAISVAHATKLKAEGKFPVMRIPAVPIDYITSFKFYRKIGNRNVTSIGSFLYSDAVNADCFTKDTYKKYPKIMIGHRAFIYGARDIADDLLMGCMSIEELNSINGTHYNEDNIIDITEIQN